MLILNPWLVKFGTVTLENVVAVTIDRSAEREVLEWGDEGPFATFADVPEQRVAAIVKQALTREETQSPRPGDTATLVIFTAPTAGDTGRQKLSAQGIVVAATIELRSTASGAAPGMTAIRTLKFALVSSNGAADPVTVSDAGAEV
ncbi:MAG: hypothetical protein AABZ53_06900 [Planctomycetota bacterium]